MPTLRIYQLLKEYRAAREALNTMRSEPAFRQENVFSHDELVKADEEALNNYVISTLRTLIDFYFIQHKADLDTGNRSFLERDKKSLLEKLGDTMYIDKNAALRALLSNDPTALTVDLADRIISENLFEELVTLYSDKMLVDPANAEKDLESIYDYVSEELTRNAKAGHDLYDVIPGLLGPNEKKALQIELAEVRDSVERYRNTSKADPFIDRQNEIEKKLNDHANAEAGAAMTGREIAKYLEEIDPDDSEAVRGRLAELTAVLASDQSNRLLSNGYKLQGDYERSARFLLELMQKSAGIPIKWMLAGGSVGFEELAAQAKEKYADVLKQSDIDRFCEKHNARYRSIMTDAQAIDQLMKAGLPDRAVDELDLDTIGEMENTVAGNYEKLLGKVLDGRVRLDAFAGMQLDRSPKCVAAVAEYLDKLLKTPRFDDLRKDALDPDRLKKICDNTVDSQLALSEYAMRFNGQLGKREMTDGEWFELMNSRNYESLDTSASVKHVGITKFVDRDSELLNDAFATCARFEEYHRSHSWAYRIFHPVNYYREYQRLAKMKSVFTEKFGMTAGQLTDRLREAAGSSADAINLYFIKKTDRQAYGQFVNDYEDRRAARRDLIDRKLENVKLFGNANTEAQETADLKAEIPDLKEQLETEQFEKELEKSLDDTGRKTVHETQKLQLDGSEKERSPIEKTK